MLPKVRPTSVVRTDQEALSIMLSIHAMPDPLILDVTYNTGKMWKGLEYPVVTNDLSHDYETDFHDDFRKLSHADSSFDVIVYDPPHLTHAGGTGKHGQWANYYGLAEKYHHENGPTAAYMGFLEEASRVLRANGVVLAKICDQVHGQIYRWQTFDFIAAARSINLTPCDLLIKYRYGRPLDDPRWKSIHHVRKNHSFWVVIRKGECSVTA